MKPHRVFSALAVLSVAVSVSAQTLFTESFDTSAGLPAFYGTGTVSYFSGAGVEGEAVRLEMPFTGWGQDLAFQLQRGAVTGNSSSSLGDYVLSFDLYQTGITSETAVARLRIEGWANVGFAGAQTASGEGNLDIPADGVWTHYDLNLGDTLPVGTFDPTSATWQLIFNPKAWEVGGPGSYVLLIDNVGLSLASPIPEPSAFAALVGLGLAVTRRRSRR